MIYHSNTQGVNFIQGLSRMWRILFSQADELQTAYKAAEQVWAQAYMDILQDMLGTSLQKQRVFRRLLFRHSTFNDVNCFVVPGFLPGTERYLLPVEIADKGWKVNNINYIGNSLVAPTAFLERNIDFEMVLDGSVELQTYRGREPNLPNQDYVSFTADPFQNPQFAKKAADETFFNITSPIGPVVDYAGLGVVVGDLIHIVFDSGGREFFIPISGVAPSQLTFDTAYINVMDDDPDRMRNRGFRYEVLSAARQAKVAEVRGRFLASVIRTHSVAVWFADVLVDDYALSQVYGALLGAEETSTENYKLLLRGLLQYYVRGTSIARTTSAVHVIAGLPVFDSDGETVDRIVTTGPSTTILTDTNLYTTSPTHPLQDDVLKAAVSIDGNTPDNTARWALFPRGFDIKLLNVNSGHKLRILDGAGPGAPLDVDILKAYNNSRLLLASGSPVTAGPGEYFGFSVGNNAPAYDNLIPLNTDSPLIVEDFTRTTPTFSALSPMTSAVTIVDHVTTPEWWEGKLLPEAIFGEPNTARRTANLGYFPSKIGTPNIKIGDPMYKVGADEWNRGQGDANVIIEIPYFDKTLVNSKDFRRGELIQTLAGIGNGEGILLWHNRVRGVLYVKIKRGQFFTGDRIHGHASQAFAFAAARSRIRVRSTTGIPLSTYTATGGGSGKATGVVAYVMGNEYLELYERPSMRTVNAGDTLTVGGTSTPILSVEELGFAPSHRGIAKFLMDEVWKNGIVHIAYDFTSFEFPRGLQNLRELVINGAEGRVYVFIEPFTSFIEVVPPPSDEVAIEFTRVFNEQLTGFDTNIKINGPRPGGGTWLIGDPGFVIGGTNPAYDASNVESFAGGAAVADLAVGIVITP